MEFIDHSQILRYEEIERIVRVALQLGMTGVRLTGGEPLVRKGVIDFIKRVSQLQGIQKLILTTNGILLSQYTVPLRQTGIAYLNISLDTLNRKKFRQITRFDKLEAVLEGIRAAKKAGFSLIKINAVSIRGINDDELFDFVAFSDTYDVVLRFIEYMPFSGNEWQRDRFISSRELKERLEQRYVLIPLDGDPSASAKTYKIPGHKGSIGFISPISESFCATCNRLRLTADGHLRPCLHGNIEIDVKGPIRCGASDADIAALICEAIDKKPISHQNFLDRYYQKPVGGREMVRIGG